MIFKNNTPVVITEKAIFNKQYKNPVYIVLMHSGSLMANIIKKVTNDTFSHSCIAFNSKLDPLYSFGTKGKGSSGIGFSVSDSKDKFFQTHNAYYHVYVMYVTDEALEKMKQKITYFEENSSKFKYDFSGLIDIYRGVSSEDHIYKMFCSRFVMSIINLSTTLDKVPSLWRPNDITNLENISLVNKGENFYEYDYKITEANEKAIKNGTYNEDSILEQSESSDSDYTNYSKYIISGDKKENCYDIQQDYKSRYKSFTPIFGLPNNINIDKLEDDAYKVATSSYKHNSSNNNRDYPFKFYRKLSIDEKDLFEMINTIYGIKSSFTKIYQYNFSRKNKRISIIIFTNKIESNRIETYILINDTTLKKFNYNNIITENFGYNPGMRLDTQFTKMKLSDAMLRVYGTQMPSLEHIKINKDTIGYIWIDEDKLVAILNMEDKDDDNRWITTLKITSAYESDAFYNQLIKIAIQNKATNIRVSKNNEKLQKLLKQNGFKQYDKTESMIYYERQ